jgi:hypothetical protein
MSGKLVRGLRASISGKGSYVLAAAPGLCAAAPVTELLLIELKQRHAARLGDAPYAPRIRDLAIDESELRDEGVEALLAGSGWAALRHLRFRDCGVGEPGVRAILGWPGSEHLETLELDGRIGAGSVEAIASARSLPRLRELGLRRAVADEERVPDLPAVDTIDLGCNQLRDAGVAALLQQPALRGCRHLGLEQNDIGPRGVEALARAELPALEGLVLSANHPSAPSLIRLAEAFPGLTTLHLQETSNVDVTVAQAFAKSPWTRLRALRAGHTGMQAASLRALGRGPFQLESLDLWANQIGEEGARALVEGPAFRSLRTLSLGYCELGDPGLEVLASGDWPRLRGMLLRGNAIGDRGAEALAASEGLPSLCRVVLEENPLTKAALARLADKYGGAYGRYVGLED